MLGKVRPGWPLSKPIRPLPAAVRRPTPGPGCVQDLALKRLQSGVKDVDLWSSCKSSSSLIEQGRNGRTCSGGAGTGMLSWRLWGCAGLSHLTRGSWRGGVAARCLQSGCLTLHWGALESGGGKGHTQICRDYLAISPLTLDLHLRCAPRDRHSTEQLPKSTPAPKPALQGT